MLAPKPANFCRAPDATDMVTGTPSVAAVIPVPMFVCFVALMLVISVGIYWPVETSTFCRLASASGSEPDAISREILSNSSFNCGD